MHKPSILLFVLAILLSGTLLAGEHPSYDALTQDAIYKPGFFNYYYAEKEGKIYLEIHDWKQEFLYVTFLAAGVGSNDIGLDRGQIGGEKVVRFERYGNKVLLIQPNYSFRAISDNPDEKRAVQEAFAQSVLGGFEILAEKDGRSLIDITDFIVRDAHHVGDILKNKNQGTYTLDKGRSVIYPENTKNFPKNSEFEALLTFQGAPTGAQVRQVVPSPNAVTVRQRHSFVALPDSKYQKRTYDPRAGFFGIEYMDFATPIDQDIHKRYISRHRLIKKNARKSMSKPVAPIIYYVDRGAPEPIRSALIEGASWWNQAFEAAGFKDAFQVKVLPEGADPLDVRYNVIQWVHRSTRGWSYGGTIIDPRTGEIIKGHVSLGSLRVRQDMLIAQGLLKTFAESDTATYLLKKMALARLRQLAAHEVGHTLGLAHNYLASTFRHGSVMDYPFPKITLQPDGNIDLSDAYDTGIGEWDKVAIKYGYAQFKGDEKAQLNKILEEGKNQGLTFLTDQDARPRGSAHPQAHLWDNGRDAADELTRILKIRQAAINRFSETNIRQGAPMATLEDVLAPIYFLHRYQTEAAAKIIGGLQYSYAMRGDGDLPTHLIPADLQQKALEAVLQTIRPESLALPVKLLRIIPPKPMGYKRNRENIKSRTGLTFDPLSAAESAARMSLQLLLNPQRCARLVVHHARVPEQPSMQEVLSYVHTFIQKNASNPMTSEIRFLVNDIFVDQLISLSENTSAWPAVRAATRAFLSRLSYEGKPEEQLYIHDKIEKYLQSPGQISPVEKLAPPGGSPIGNEDFNQPMLKQ